MSYIALARKWRPRTFLELVGQEHITKALTKSLTQQRIHHAYLFTGTRGVGKTSVARLLAKALNCEQGISATPCLSCDACTAIEKGSFVDLIEVDGASRTRVEDTRDLLENVHYAPTHGRFKIYLIDEVHMLSQHSFNALLKTLEEPPAHVKFLLATTDPHKLPVTVLSRCLQFNLKHLQQEIIVGQLQLILKDEALHYEQEALELLARAANGSMRDALSLLDQAIAGVEKELSLREVKELLGISQQDYALKLLNALAKQSPQTLLSISRDIAKEGGYFEYTLEEMLHYLHQMSIQQHLGSTSPLISANSEIVALSSQFSQEDTQLFYQIGIKGREEMHLAPTIAVGFEMTLLRMYAFQPVKTSQIPTLAHQVIKEAKPSFTIQEEPLSLDQEPPRTPIASNQQFTSQENFSSPNQELQTLIKPAQQINKQEELEPLKQASCQISQTSDNLNMPLEESIPQQGQIQTRPHSVNHQTSEITPVFQKQPNNDASWFDVLAKLQLTGLARNAIEHAEFVEKSQHQIVFRIATGHLSLFTPTTITRIENELSRHYNETIKISLNAESKTHETPAQKKEISRVAQQQEATLALENDPFFQQLQQEFSAELVKNSIASLKDDL